MLLQLVFGLAMSQAASAATVTQELERVEQRLAATWRNGDCSGWGDMLAPDWTVIHTNGALIRKTEALESCRGPRPPIEKLAIDDVRVRPFGDVAVVTGRTTMVTGGEKPATMVIRFTDVFVRAEGKWLAVASHASPVTQ